MGSRLPFRHVVLADFEYRQIDGELPEVRCLCARDMCSGREWRLWADELGACPPFPTGADSLFVGYYLSAEFSAFHALGWPLPAHSLDLYVEFRVATNGRPTPWGKRSLLAALEHFEIDGIDAAEKQDMRGLATRPGPSSSYGAAERRDLLDYCMTDVLALECLLRPILREVLFAAGDAPRRCFRQALMRGEYMAALAAVEARGVPIDVDMFDRLRRAWHQIPRRLAARLDPKFGVFVDGKVSRSRLAEYLVREELYRSWPRTEARGWLDTSADTFKEMARLHPRLEPLHQAVATLAQAKNLALKVGADGRNRAFLSGFGAKTGRNTPSSTEYVFGLSAWMRHLIKPVPEHTLLYVDWHAQEPGIGGTLSRDGALIEAYDQGDVYLGFAKLSGLAPTWATKASHGDLRDAIKVTFLAVGYGMGASTLARQLGCPVFEARDLLSRFRLTFPDYTAWTQSVVAGGCLFGRVRNKLGWPLWVGGDTRPTTLLNFPMQSGGSAMMQAAVILAHRRGVPVVGVVHDALLVECDDADAAEVEIATVRVMRDASALILGGRELRVDTERITHPDRYVDKRGVEVWRMVLDILDEVAVEAGDLAVNRSVSNFPPLRARSPGCGRVSGARPPRPHI